MTRVFRFIIYLSNGFKLKKPFNLNAIRTWWFLSRFSIRGELQYYSSLIMEIDRVARCCGLVADNTRLLRALIRGRSIDLKYITGISLSEPSCAILTLLKYYGDINQDELIRRWSWATMRDEKTNKKYRPINKQVAENQSILRNIVADIHLKITKGESV